MTCIVQVLLRMDWTLEQSWERQVVNCLSGAYPSSTLLLAYVLTFSFPASVISILLFIILKVNFTFSSEILRLNFVCIFWCILLFLKLNYIIEKSRTLLKTGSYLHRNTRHSNLIAFKRGLRTPGLYHKYMLQIGIKCFLLWKWYSQPNFTFLHMNKMCVYT